MEGQEYSKGDYVIYGVNGICKIEDVRVQKPAFGDGAAQPVYVLRRLEKANLTITVPVGSEKLMAKMRRLFTKAEIDALLLGAREHEIEWIEDKRERANAFRGIMMQGVREDLILMIRCIYLQKQNLLLRGKKLNIADEEALKTAERLVKEEFAYSLGIEPDAVGTYIRNALRIDDAVDETALTPDD
ncbi:MAG: CarD family transcriptional regulator [Eubacteriales bacterium]|nr:CarD family transcriptional regulator [Eubacteriales bacterium]